jgi:dethiobiotin synthetase
MRGLFVTGTDTNVGKTVVCAALMHRYRGHYPLRYWKPVQTGLEEADDTATVRRLGDCTDVEILDQGVRLKRPLSPHIAAELEGETIELARVCKIATGKYSEFHWIVEGAGGVLVPLNDKALMINLIKILEIPVVVVARTDLGTINHTLLTIESLKQREVPIVGLVLVGESRVSTRKAIEMHSSVAVLGEMPRFKDLSAQTLGDWARKHLDPRNHVSSFLQWQLGKSAQ